MTAASSNAPQRAYWLKKLHEWHWISSAVCLIGMLLFAVTGFTLNHAGQIESKPKVESRDAQLPRELLEKLQQAQKQGVEAADKNAVGLPAEVDGWLAQQIKVSAKGFAVEWSEDEAYVPMPRPGGDAWLRVDLKEGSVEYEKTDRGWISYLNDLHKGRNTGGAWSLFIDVFAIGCLVFCITGLLILKMHAQRRPMTWPMVGLGLVLPALLVLLLVH
ncbi:PepSY-associated TM helix domain-containing protein [Comamonas thiooxydans]|uniref:PepSY-associated TM helix domain-containing protein n=1 Tax=Comamonas thiooxydans TaxID=363952 RepID=A0AA42Q253_9BURK|nr:PepSY-associated TM helix domain-containing protein [Comamonas thiooxydans]MDH1335514.1 PepSY-associated TM helix domain-containing protein [Comamonas thiooxydans]MDH1741455.1 PepSY-associated TM helix domain-containing protein [Comamonas thiooxydans]MDH1787981.1 PepSY-associated TM helix domain-containing protein [Comamonas thiooxydans]